MYRDLGMVTSRSTHVAVYINDEFYGLYISVEHIDDEFLEKNFSDDSGNLWKCIWPADLTYRGGDPEDYHPYYDDERPYTLKTNKDSYCCRGRGSVYNTFHRNVEGYTNEARITESIG